MHKSCIRTLPIVAAAVFGFAFTHAAAAADNVSNAALRTANGGYALNHITRVRQPDPRDHRRPPREIIEPEEFDEPDERDHRGYGGGRQICCKRGRHEWWAWPRQCRRSGGVIVSPRYCRRGHGGGDYGRSVCCKWRRHADGRWTSRRRCIRSGGHIVSPRACRYGRHDHRDDVIRDHRGRHH